MIKVSMKDNGNEIWGVVEVFFGTKKQQIYWWMGERCTNVKFVCYFAWEKNILVNIKII